AAAEAASGHAGAERPGAEGRVDGRVELDRGDLVVVAHGDVRGGQEVADPGHRPAFEDLDGGQDALVLGEDVPQAPVQPVVVEPRLGRGVAQVGDAEQPRGLLAVGAAGGV